MIATAQKTTVKKTKQPVKGQDKFIARILENLDKVKAQDWEVYTNHKQFICNVQFYFQSWRQTQERLKRSRY